jgi:galactofuranose transport system substrate-binding protein
MKWSSVGRFVFVLSAISLMLFMFIGIAPAKQIVLGFVQVSSEGTWRLTNSKSIKEAAEKAGIKLLFREGMNNYTNQTNELRELIASGVDVLAFSPSQLEGWDKVLNEAKDAGIPVIIVDRMVETSDPSLYTTFIGSDMVEEGRRAANWLVKYMNSINRGTGEVRVVVLEGIKGSTPAVNRDKGFREVLNKYPNYKIVASEPADYIFSKGEEVMSNFLAAQEGKIDVVFAHNDEMALGAIEAIREYDKVHVHGKDIIVVGVDAIKKAFETMIKGEMHASIECSPLLGPQLMQAVKDIVDGKKVPREIITVEHDYDQSNAAQELPNRTY